MLGHLDSHEILKVHVMYNDVQKCAHGWTSELKLIVQRQYINRNLLPK